MHASDQPCGLKTPVEETGERGHTARSSGGKKATAGNTAGWSGNRHVGEHLHASFHQGVSQAWCWIVGTTSVLVTYADDFVVLCRHGAGEVLETTRRWMASMRSHAERRPRRVYATRRCEPFEPFLGYTFGPMYSLVEHGGSATTVARHFSRRLVASVKEHIRRRLRSGNHAPWEDVARGLNRTVRGWSAYFSYGSVRRTSRHGVKLYLYHAVRRFLRRLATKWPGLVPQRRFPTDEVFGKLGRCCLPNPRPHEVWSAKDRTALTLKPVSRAAVQGNPHASGSMSGEEKRMR